MFSWPFFEHVQHQSLRGLDCGFLTQFFRNLFNPEMDETRIKNVGFLVHSQTGQAANISDDCFLGNTWVVWSGSRLSSSISFWPSSPALNSKLSSHVLLKRSWVCWISWEVIVYRDPHAVLHSSNQLMLSFGWHHTKVVCNIMRCMMRFFQIISMLSMLWIFFHLPRKHCDVSDAITELHTWTITPSMGNKVYPVIVYNSVYYMYSGYIYSI